MQSLPRNKLTDMHHVMKWPETKKYYECDIGQGMAIYLTGGKGRKQGKKRGKKRQLEEEEEEEEEEDEEEDDTSPTSESD